MSDAPPPQPLVRADDVRDACLRTLTALGYARRTETMRIVNLEFHFEAVFVVPADDHALVFVVEVADLDDAALDALRRRLARLSLALTRAESLRPVTVVLVTPATIPARALDTLRPLARLVVVERRDQTEDHLREVSLREFRPLVSVARPSPEAVTGALARHLGAAGTEPGVRALRLAAAKGADVAEAARAVEAAFSSLLAAAIVGPSPDSR